MSVVSPDATWYISYSYVTLQNVTWSGWFELFWVFMLCDCIHTRGHNYKLFKLHCSLDVRKYFLLIVLWILGTVFLPILSAHLVFRHLKGRLTVMSLCLTIRYIINFLLFVIWIQTHLVPVFLSFCGLSGSMLVLFVQPLHPVVLRCTINDIFDIACLCWKCR